jgi:ketopantoate hydroxymethyltransferase
MNRRTTVYDLQSQKGRKKWLQIHVDTVDEASGAAAVEVEVVPDFVQLEAELQHRRVAAFKAFVDDVADGGYPAADHQVEMDDDSFDEFLDRSRSL